MNCMLFVVAATAILVAETLGVPLNEEALPGPYLEDPGVYGYPVSMEKRRTVGRGGSPIRPQLADYLKMAALQYELDREEAEGMDSSAEELAPYSAEPEDGHAVEKRRRRYGFWATAINKMDGHHLKGFLGKHKNIYNIYKRAQDMRNEA